MGLITESYLRTLLPKGIPNPFPLRAGDKITPAAADFLKGRGIVLKPVEITNLSEQPEWQAEQYTIPVGVSNRHVHLSPEDVEILFGPGYSLVPDRELSQPGQFAAKEKVTLLGPKGFIQGVRILGPARGATQVEISRTDGFHLGVHAPVRLSGDIEGTPGITLIGPNGCVVLKQGVIVAKRHVHMSPADAERFQVKNGDTIILQTPGDRPIIYPDVVVRVSDRFVLDFHVDLDEGNAANLRTGDYVYMTGKNGQLLTRTGR
ncbi:phosphate propanoyltransferase [Brevibacillus sp. SYP-B805]|uniref:phosphate propanoyltransferase n=1 Tax=Brevibacillus sp. SYP-B805 TaxID=1578199 RepID=UPI0013ED44F3|nr:phosphate propanoyltransferase [Brevibacillus sp. SYP-B805]NGQ96926.1 phosphate propanoyltransferase [Brevibacillus sp. SYP-B805]